MADRLYWLGNAAKTRIISEILSQITDRANGKTLIFDYGCGAAGDWPAVLSEHPQLALIGYDPCRKSIATAKERLQGLEAQLYTGDELREVSFEADFIVSFSVLEHVYDRRAFLETARRHLKKNGLFYLNYDDGHFRNYLNLNAPGFWPGPLREWLHNLMAAAAARLGMISAFQQRVPRAAADQLVKEAGFSLVAAYYSNLASLKEMAKTLPVDGREEFARFWMEMEKELNSRFLHDTGKETLGDRANLWQVMGSRTLVLSREDT